MNVLDLFSGIGGFSLGLERAGMRTVGFCEIDPYCRRVLKKYWPEIPVHKNVETFKPMRGCADVICGGFPCQDISEAGARVGIKGARSALWSEYVRIIGLVRPRYIIVENVADLLIRGTDIVLGDLAALGYDAEWHCIPASAIGADHFRDRIWIIAYPNSAGNKSLHKQRRKSRAPEMGEDVTAHAADHNGYGPQGGGNPGTLNEDARAISPWLGLALSSPPPFPGEFRSCKPVLGRGEDGIPDRIHRMHALGNAIVPQIAQCIGEAIMQFESGAVG